MADPAVMLKQAAALYKKGERDKARDILLKLIEIDENNEKAWLLLSAAVDGLEDKQIALENVLTINPKNEKARKGLDLINKKLAQMPAKKKDEPLGGSGWSDIDTEAKVEPGDDGWGAYLDDSQSQSPFARSGETSASSATPVVPAESSGWGDDSGWGDLDASSVFTQAEENSSASAPVSTTPSTPAAQPDEPAGSSWGDIDTGADPWGNDASSFETEGSDWAATPSSPEPAADASPWGSEPASPASSAPIASTASGDAWGDTDFSFDDDSSSPWGSEPASTTPSTPAASTTSADPWGDADFSFEDEASPWGETPAATPAQPAKAVPSQPSGDDYDQWMDELNLKTGDSVSTSAFNDDSSPWGDTSLTSEPEEASPWAQDAAVISDAWSDWGTGETPAASPSAPAEEASPWGASSTSSSASPFSSGGSVNPFGDMSADDIEDMASSTSLGMDENPFDSPIDVNAASPFTQSPASQSSGGGFGFGGSAFDDDDLLDEDDDDAGYSTGYSLYADDDEDELESLSDSISDFAGRDKRLSMASSGAGQTSGDQYFRMIPNEIQVPPKRKSAIGVLLTVLVLVLLNVGALGLLVSQLLG